MLKGMTLLVAGLLLAALVLGAQRLLVQLGLSESQTQAVVNLVLLLIVLTVTIVVGALKVMHYLSHPARNRLPNR